MLRHSSFCMEPAIKHTALLYTAVKTLRLRLGAHLTLLIGPHKHSNWKCLGCWPKAWKVNGFDGKGNDVVTEEITFVVEEMLIET